MILSLTFLLNLYESELLNVHNNIQSENNNKEYFLLTNRLNQDPLENMFSIVRQKNGYTRNPTARMFHSCFASISSFSLIKASSSLVWHGRTLNCRNAPSVRTGRCC